MRTATLSKPGTLIHARGREWVVLPESNDDLLMARPVGGLDEEITGILPAVEPVESSAFPLPTRNDIGDFTSGQILRDAARLSTRAAAGPFRSFGRIAAEPRPYQLVPLMMALKLDPVRLLIADDVGIGKTIEAAVIARELLDRGEIRRLVVLCPPHLAEQWQRELDEKFHIEAELVLSSTIQRLERDLPVGVSVFDRHRFTIVSTDFIKSARRAEDFVLKCPEFVIVDEAADEEVDEVGRRTVLDQDDVDDVLALDFSPGSGTESGAESTRRKLLEFARRAEALTTDEDHKLQGAIGEIRVLLRDGFQPIVFCRFVDTADYVARQFREALPAKVQVESVTGLLPPAEREARIESLVAESGQYVLVCTDCLAEGVNLQQHFNAVLHYDLAWNPTRHEQREGRVDRFGQDRPEVRVITYYGKDNPIDGVILDVLIRKHKSIRSDLGVTVAVPGSSEQIAEALFEGALFRTKTSARSQQLALDFIDDFEPKKQAIHAEWENARDREKASRSRFAQHTLSPKAVAAELQSVRAASRTRGRVTIKPVLPVDILGTYGVVPMPGTGCAR